MTASSPVGNKNHHKYCPMAISIACTLIWPTPSDNVQCRGETRIDKAEFCHFDSRSRGKCAPTAEVILKEQNLSSAASDEIPGVDGLCDCKFREGKSVCVDGMILTPL